MNEDEAFIRAIVDSPGDDTARLVYADWLDDRDDPRGPYLRAECEWGRAWREGQPPGDASMLRELAVGLDPVWVARVSRAPMGVCCEHLARSSAGRRPDPIDVQRAGVVLGLAPPEQLRALLLNYALGKFRAGPLVLTPEHGRGRVVVDGLVCLVDPDFRDGWASQELIDQTLWDRNEYNLDDRFAFLASTSIDGADFVVSCRSSDRGTVCQMNGHTDPDDPDTFPAPVAPSVGAFLAMLRPPARPLTDNGTHQESRTP